MSEAIKTQTSDRTPILQVARQKLSRVIHGKRPGIDFDETIISDEQTLRDLWGVAEAQDRHAVKRETRLVGTAKVSEVFGIPTPENLARGNRLGEWVAGEIAAVSRSAYIAEPRLRRLITGEATPTETDMENLVACLGADSIDQIWPSESDDLAPAVTIQEQPTEPQTLIPTGEGVPAEQIAALREQARAKIAARHAAEARERLAEFDRRLRTLALQAEAREVGKRVEALR